MMVDLVANKWTEPAPVKIHKPGLNEANAKRLWEVSEQLTGVHFAELDK